MKFLPVSPTNYADFEHLFESRGGPKHCWCMVFRPMPAADRRAGPAAKKAAISKTIADDVPVGILAYDDDDEPIAWCSIAPIATYSNLRTRTYTEAENEPQNVWSIACFYIRSPYRRQGMTTQLIQSAIAYAKQNGAETIEAYPVDYDSPSYSYMGRIGTFERLGFKEIAMAGTRRHIMRLHI